MFPRDPGSAFKSARLGVAGQIKKRASLRCTLITTGIRLLYRCPYPRRTKRMARGLGTVFVRCAALLVTSLNAQDRQIGGVGITIHEDVDFKGRNATVREAIPDLTRYGMFLRVSSLAVAPGESREGGEDVNFQGR